MKIRTMILTLCMGLAVIACAPKQSGEATEQQPEQANPGTEVTAQDVTPAPEVEKTAKDFVPSKATIDSVSYLLGVNYGSFLKGYGFDGNLNYSAMIKGMKDFIKNEVDPSDPAFKDAFKVNPELINDLFNNFLSNKRQYKALKGKEDGEKFLAANKKRPNVVETASGLQYEIVSPGSDKRATAIDTVKVFYKGSLLNGKVFDETKDEAIDLTLNHVIPGWQEGLQLVGEGGKIKLFIPADLAYGEMGTRGIDPNSTLIFDVEVVEVRPYVEPVAEEAAE